LLRAEGWVNRLPYFELGREKGGVGYVYGLSDKAVRNLLEDPIDDPKHCFVTKTFDEHSQRTLDHELEISFFHVALKDYCVKNHIGLDWYQRDLKRGIHPDALFKLTTEKGELRFFLEIEKQRMNGRRGDEEPNIIKKLRRYAEYYDTPDCQKDWGFRKFRVVVVHKTMERMDNLLHAMKPILPHRMFWLTTEEAYKDDIGSDIFATPKDFDRISYSFNSL
jgi:hypothetical protein